MLHAALATLFVAALACAVTLLPRRTGARPSGAASVPAGANVDDAPPDAQGLWQGARLGRALSRPAPATHSTYQVARGAGSAPSLLGRVALVHLFAGRPSDWSGQRRDERLSAAFWARDFYLDQARGYGVSGLRIDLFSMDATSPSFSLPPQPCSGPGSLALRREIDADLERARRRSLRQLVGDYQAKGYDSVALFVHITNNPSSNSCALLAGAGVGREAPEVALIFDTQANRSSLPSKIGHEGLHLFGADDLYNIPARDPSDANDLMRGTCREGHPCSPRIRDATAYAIGWLARPPARRYAFTPRPRGPFGDDGHIARATRDPHAPGHARHAATEALWAAEAD